MCSALKLFLTHLSLAITKANSYSLPTLMLYSDFTSTEVTGCRWLREHRDTLS